MGAPYDVFLTFVGYSVRVSCPLLSRQKLYSLAACGHSISPGLSIIGNSKAAFSSQPLLHQLYSNSEGPVAQQFCEAVRLLLSPCRLKESLPLLKTTYLSNLVLYG